MDTTGATYDLDALCTLAGLPRRTVRYYIQLGLVDRPDGETRAARYTGRHLAQLQQIRQWTGVGLSLEQVRERLGRSGGEPRAPRPAPAPGSVTVRSHLNVADGVELVIEPGLAGLKAEEVRELFRQVMAAYSAVSNRTTEGEQDQ